MIKVHNKLSGKDRIAGLELVDILVLAFLYLLIFICSNHLFLNILMLVSVYLFLRTYKKGKPPHFTASVIRFLIARPRYHRTVEHLGEECA